jgi:hypothetical protein
VREEKGSEVRQLYGRQKGLIESIDSLVKKVSVDTLAQIYDLSGHRFSPLLKLYFVGFLKAREVIMLKGINSAFSKQVLRLWAQSHILW